MENFIKTVTDAEINALAPEDFFEILDVAGGVNAPLELWERFVWHASDIVKNHEDFVLYKGILFGRQIHAVF